jgi:hypothetical protein
VEERGNAYKNVVEDSERKQPLGRLGLRLRWEDVIKVDIRKMWLGGFYWIYLAHGRGW